MASYLSKSKPPLFLALDIGTSSVRAGLYTHEADVLPETMIKKSRQLEVTADGGFEIDAVTAFEQVVGAVDELHKKCGERAQAAQYGGISSFWHSIVGVDQNGEPTTKLFAWAETRPAVHVARLRHDLDEPEIHNRTGCPFHSSYWPAKILWIRESFPEKFEITSKWLSFSDFLGQKMFGSRDTSISMASGTGIFDIRKQQWDTELVEYLGLAPENLPVISGDDSPVHSFINEYRERWPGIAGSKWFPAIGDGAANNIGAGCLTRSKAALMIGTSGAMRVAYEGEPPVEIPHGLWCYRIDKKRVVIGGALSDGGGLYRWLKDNLGLSEHDNETEKLIAARKPAAHGLTFLPFLAGERSTGYNDFATGAVFGLRTATDKIDIVQAAFEAVAYRFADIFNRLCGVLEIEEIIASGGALRESPVWTQIICDVIGRDMSLPATREASSRGVVMLASLKTGFIDDIGKPDQTGAVEFSHNPSHRDAYDRAMKQQLNLYAKLVERKQGA